MTSINTVFKRIFGEALEPYGFVRIKGKYPYFIRMVGDEILQVISYKNEWNMSPYKSFNILGGISTVYRKSLCLEKNPRDNTVWLDDNSRIYCELEARGESEGKKRVLEFDYIKDSETSLIDAVQYSLEVTKEVMLPELLRVTDLKACLEYYRCYNSPCLLIHTDEDFGQKNANERDNEGLLNLKVYNLEEFTEVRRNMYKKTLEECKYKIEHLEKPEYKEAIETRERNSKERMLEQITNFEKLYNDPDMYAKVMEELEHRKAENLNTLRMYGVVK